MLGKFSQHVTAILAFALLAVVCGHASAQNVLVQPNSDFQAIGRDIEYYPDSSESLSIDDILGPRLDVNFIPNNREILHFGLTSSAYWLHFKLDWSNVPGNASKVLEFGPPKHVPGLIRGGISVYLVDDNRQLVDSYSLGSIGNPAEIRSLNRGFALKVDSQFSHNVYVRVASARPLRLPISIWNDTAFHQAETNASAFLGLQYGVLLAMILYNLFLFISIREWSFLFYVINIVSQLSFLFLDSKHIRYMIGNFHSDNWYIDIAERTVYPLMALTAILFQRSLLRVWEYNPKLDNIAKLLLAGFVITALLALVPDEKIHQFLFLTLISVTIPLGFYTNIDAIRRGNASAFVHMLAIGVFLICVSIHTIAQLLPSFADNIVTTNAFSFGLIAQALLLSFGLAFRYNEIKKEKEGAQQLAINNLIRAEQVKDDLLANVTHELRTPLFGINGLAEAAVDGLKQDSNNITLVRRNLELIQTSGDRLAKLVNDLLDFSKSQDDTSYVKFRPVDLNSISALAIAICKPLVGDKEIDLRTEIEEDLPLVAGDEDRLQQVLVNLTSNAIKFTHSGEIVICAAMASDYTVRLSVRDTGIGIHNNDYNTIFKTFEKLPSQGMPNSGLGLGLPISKRVIDMHRSKLHVESKLDVGSTFSFELLVSIDQTQVAKPVSIDKQMIRRADYLRAPEKKIELPKLTSQEETVILIVDDDEINRVVMEQQLDGYTVLQCTNGVDAISLVEDQKPDLILLDLMMPGINGYEVCQNLRQRYSQIELPIILVTAKNHLEDLTFGFKMGANDYLPKPFHSEELKSRVANQLHLSMLHKIHEHNTALKVQIETYVSADAELRSSRFRLEKVLESIDTGFLAFELPGKIFSVNQRAAELLGTQREVLLNQSVDSILSHSDDNLAFKTILEKWENEELESGTSPTLDDDTFDPVTDPSDMTSRTSSSIHIEAHYPFSIDGSSTGKTVNFASQLKLFSTDEGTGILFLEASRLSATDNSAIISDTVELVSFIEQAQQNIRRIGTRLSVVTPDELLSYPELLDRLSGVEALINYIDEQLPSISQEGEYRQQLVTLTQAALHTWEVTTQKSKIELAEGSNIWAVSIDNGRLRTRTFDRYLRIEHLPKVPRWREVVRTALFVLSNTTIEPEARTSLEAELEKTKTILKKAAIN